MTTLPWATAITVNCRNHRDTIECVESLLKQDYPNFHIFVLDNGSFDDSAEQLEVWGRRRLGNDFLSLPVDGAGQQSFCQKVVLFKSGENLGFAGGNNLVCQFALCAGAVYIWFINNDTVQDSAALSKLVSVVQENSTAGMVCSKILYSSKADTIESMGSSLIVPFGIFRHIRHGAKDSGLSSVPMEIPYVYGCSFLVSAGLIKAVGLMDERYFLLREESDWSLRARRKGWRLYCSPESRVWHKGTASMGKRSGTFFYYVTRNTLLFMQKHYPLFLPTAALVMFPLVCGLILVDSLLSERRGPIAKLRMAALGYLDFFRGRFGRLKE